MAGFSDAQNIMAFKLYRLPAEAAVRTIDAGMLKALYGTSSQFNNQ
jgi:hypothetical protein